MKACFQIAECSFSSTKIRWFLLKLFIKNEPLFVKSKLGLIFLWFFQISPTSNKDFSSLFLSSQEIRGTEILVFPLSKGFFSLYYKKKEKFLLYLRKGKTPSLSKERKSPLNKNQEDSFFPPLLISLQPVEHSDFNTVCIIIGQSGSLTVIILAPGIGEEEAEIQRFYYHFFHHSTWTGWLGNRCRADFPCYYKRKKPHSPAFLPKM